MYDMKGLLTSDVGNPPISIYIDHPFPERPITYKPKPELPHVRLMAPKRKARALTNPYSNEGIKAHNYFEQVYDPKPVIVEFVGSEEVEAINQHIEDVENSFLEETEH